MAYEGKGRSLAPKMSHWEQGRSLRALRSHQLASIGGQADYQSVPALISSKFGLNPVISETFEHKPYFRHKKTTEIWSQVVFMTIKRVARDCGFGSFMLRRCYYK